METTSKALLPAPKAADFTGCKRAGFYDRIADGLMPAGIGIGGARRAWPAGELEQINQARIAGKTDDEIRELVVHLETARTGTPATPRRKPPKARPEQFSAAIA